MSRRSRTLRPFTNQNCWSAWARECVGRPAQPESSTGPAACRTGSRRSGLEQHTIAVSQFEAHVKARQRETFGERGDVRKLGGVAAHELAPRGYVVEQVPYLYRGAARVCGRAHRAHAAALAGDLRRLARGVIQRGNAQAGNRADRGQRFAAEPERAHRFEVLKAGDLAGGVPRQRQRQFRRTDAAPVIAHPHQSDPTALDVDLDAARPGIEAVFDDFLDDRGRAFDYLPGSNLIDEFAGKYADSHAGGEVYRRTRRLRSVAGESTGRR